MLIDDHPYLFFYLVGCILVVVFFLVKITIFWVINWITKGNILNKNLKKLLPPDERNFGEKVALFFGALILEMALSWINVVIVLWQITSTLFRTAREVFSSTPEAIKLLRFPLRNNPNLSRESVWAYMFALQIKIGERQPNESELLMTLNDLFGYYPSFDRMAALKQLEILNVISSDVMFSTVSHLSHSKGEV